MTKDDLDEIRKRCEAATPGEWKNRPNGRHRGYVRVDEDSPNGAEEIAHVFCGAFEGHGPANAEFIAHARTDVPRLLDEVERLQRENGAHRALAMLEPKEMSYADRAEFERLKRADVEQGKRVAELSARLALLEPAWEAAKRIRRGNYAVRSALRYEDRVALDEFEQAIDAAVAKEGK